jgi:hypothetical protein
MHLLAAHCPTAAARGPLQSLCRLRQRSAYANSQSASCLNDKAKPHSRIAKHHFSLSGKRLLIACAFAHLDVPAVLQLRQVGIELATATEALGKVHYAKPQLL